MSAKTFLLAVRVASTLLLSAVMVWYSLGAVGKARKKMVATATSEESRDEFVFPNVVLCFKERLFSEGNPLDRITNAYHHLQKGGMS